MRGRSSSLSFRHCSNNKHAISISFLKINSRSSWVAGPAIESRRAQGRQNFRLLPATDRLSLSDGTQTLLTVHQNHVAAVIRLVGGPTHLG
jgi:hypothetical protein